MTKTFCDRCGKEIPAGNAYYLSNKEFYRRILTLAPPGLDTERIITEHEICEECQKSLYHWWAEGKNKE